jgi:hypothetical protein
MGADSPADGGAGAPPARGELDDAPPFLSWRGIYVVILGALAVEIAVGIVVTLLYRPGP